MCLHRLIDHHNKNVHTVFFQPNLMAYICVWLYVNLFGKILELTHNFQPWVHIGPSGKRQAIFLERQEWSTAFKNLLAIPAIYRKRVGHLRKFIKNETGSEWWLPDLLCCLRPFLLVLLVCLGFSNKEEASTIYQIPFFTWKLKRLTCPFCVWQWASPRGRIEFNPCGVLYK